MSSSPLENSVALTGRAGQETVRLVWTIPNIVTLTRLLLVPLQIHFLVIGKPWQAFACYLAAAVSDLLDGFLARKLNCRTQVGAMLDPLIDKVTIVTMVATLIYLAIIPLWFASLILFRDFLICLGVLILRLGQRRVPWRPIPIGKWTTCAQNTTILALIVHHFFYFPSAAVIVLYLITCVLTVVSLVQYTRLFFRVYRQKTYRVFNEQENRG